MGVEARLEVERDADVTGPQRVAAPPDLGPLLLDLICGVARSWNGEPSEVQGDGRS